MVHVLNVGLFRYRYGCVRVQTLARVLQPRGERIEIVKLLILDNDLGFLFWIAKALEPFGHSVVPADTVSQANRLLRRLKTTIDVLIVNPEIEGAVEFSGNLRQREPQLKVIALVSQEEKESELEQLQADATHAKPNSSMIADIDENTAESDAQSEWVEFVQRVAGRRTAGGRGN